MMLKARRRVVTIADHILDSFQDVPSSLKWAADLNGALLPCRPEQNLPLTVKAGQLPADLSGAYMRIGPNHQHWPPKKRTHVFDGDGMVHSVRIINGEALYHCSFLETPRYEFEKTWGEEWFTRIGEFEGKAGLAKILTVVNSKARLAELEDWETSQANTAIGFTPSGKLWALHEGGPPFRFKLDENGIPRSLGYDTLGDTHRKPISAHPKFDAQTGEIIFHGREIMKSFYVGRAVDGKIADCVDLKMKPGFHHDMFITENYIVIIDGSMRFDPKGAVQSKPLWNFKPKAKLRFGVFPRACKEMTADAFIWIEAPMAAEIYHTLYAFDEGGKVSLWAPMSFYKPGKAEGILGDVGESFMHRIVIDVDQRLVDIQAVAGGEHICTDFPRIRDDRIGMRVQHGFSGSQSPGCDFNFTGIMKWNFHENKLAARIEFPVGVVGGEPVFFPRGGSYSSCSSDDDGYIGMFLWNLQSEESTFALFDALTFAASPVVELLVPRRVPIGFHAAWITEEQFQQQLLVP